MPKAALSFPLLAILALGGCAMSEPAPNIGPPPAGQSERSGEITPWGLTYGAAVMTSKVYPHLAAAADANANLFISPVSLSQGLGLAYLGARGGTREEIGRALGWDSARNVPALIKSYNAQLTDTGDADTTLGIANALWLAKSDSLPLTAANLCNRAEGIAGPGRVCRRGACRLRSGSGNGRLCRKPCRSSRADQWLGFARDEGQDFADRLSERLRG